MGSKWNVIKNILKKDNLIRWNLYFYFYFTFYH